LQGRDEDALDRLPTHGHLARLLAGQRRNLVQIRIRL
jgi:hypothetical protein